MYELLLHNVFARKVRTALTAVAVAIGVILVATLGVVTHSFTDTAAAVLRTGKADFTVSQKGVSDLLSSIIDEAKVQKIAATPGVASAVGALVATTKYNAANPLFLEIGLPASQLTEFGVKVVAGQPFTESSSGQVMLGYRAADNLGKRVGDSITIDGVTYRIVGLYETGQSLGDTGAMMPLPQLQAHEREAGEVTLIFVRDQPGASIPKIRSIVEHDNPELVTIRSATEFGRVDRNLQLLDAVDRGSTVLALFIGGIVVGNTMLLSFYQRTREFGVMRAVGWSRWRLMLLIAGEGLFMGLLGAMVGVLATWGLTQWLAHLPALLGLLHPQYTADIFWRALGVALGIGFLGAMYPALRAAFLSPATALSRE
ncbi:MAG: transporter permease [Actinomycetia bacterium]|nr:transporter permease [Actinomycetes bacterium]